MIVPFSGALASAGRGCPQPGSARSSGARVSVSALGYRERADAPGVPSQRADTLSALCAADSAERGSGRAGKRSASCKRHCKQHWGPASGEGQGGGGPLRQRAHLMVQSSDAENSRSPPGLSTSLVTCARGAGSRQAPERLSAAARRPGSEAEGEERRRAAKRARLVGVIREDHFSQRTVPGSGAVGVGVRRRRPLPDGPVRGPGVHAGPIRVDGDGADGARVAGEDAVAILAVQPGSVSGGGGGARGKRA